MTFEDLRVFLAVTAADSLSAVARDLGCTQPAVAQHVSKLEAELGLQLLERSSRGVQLTGAGVVLREGARSAFGALDSALQSLGEMREGGAGSLIIATGGTTVRHFLRETILGFRESHREVELRFLPARSTGACLDLLRDHQADLALVTFSDATQEFQTIPVGRHGLRLLVPERHTLATRRRVRVDEILELPVIGLSTTTTTQGHLERAALRTGRQLDTVMEVDDLDTAALFVELGLGVAVMPAVQAWSLARGGTLRSIAIQGVDPVPVGWATRGSAQLTRAATAFIALHRSQTLAMKSIPGFWPASAPELSR